MLGLSHQSLDACRLKLCRSPIGRTLAPFMTGPFGALSGGLFNDCCPPPTAAEIAALEQKGGPQGAEAVAAKIKADEADAKARVVAVEYLGTVDCHYWKEAGKALLDALRGDRNECVRYAAAKALNSGCCCSKEVIDTLRIVVSGEDSDGFPSETSARVRGMAFAALQNCLMRVPDLPPEIPPLEPEQGPGVPTDLVPLEPERAALGPLAAEATHRTVAHEMTSQTPIRAIDAMRHEAQLRTKTFAATVDDARRTMKTVSQQAAATPAVGLPAGHQSLFDAMMKARHDVTVQRRTATPAPAPTPTTAPAGTASRGPSSGPASPSSVVRTSFEPAPESEPADDEPSVEPPAPKKKGGLARLFARP
jgi:hypothetical protein